MKILKFALPSFLKSTKTKNGFFTVGSQQDYQTLLQISTT